MKNWNVWRVKNRWLRAVLTAALTPFALFFAAIYVGTIGVAAAALEARDLWDEIGVSWCRAITARGRA